MNSASPDLRDWIGRHLDPLEDKDPVDGVQTDTIGGFPFEGTPAPAAVLIGLIERPQGYSVLLTRRADFDRLGGFDADRFPRSLYDMDYCKRLAGVGLRSVHVGDARLRWDDPHRLTIEYADGADVALARRQFMSVHTDFTAVDPPAPR